MAGPGEGGLAQGHNRNAALATNYFTSFGHHRLSRGIFTSRSTRREEWASRAGK